MPGFCANGSRVSGHSRQAQNFKGNADLNVCISMENGFCRKRGQDASFFRISGLCVCVPGSFAMASVVIRRGRHENRISTN